MRTDLFEPFTLSEQLILPNRFVRSATWEGMASEKGEVTDSLIDLMTSLSKGNLGLLISSYAYVSQDAKDSPGQIGISQDYHIPGLHRMVNCVHESGSKIAVQIMHTGLQGSPEINGFEPKGPSDFSYEGQSVGRAMTMEEIQQMIENFASAAQRAEKAGFDAIQLHGAHGYGISQFLSPFFNQRTDKYGGSLRKRYQLLHEIIVAIKEKTSAHLPLMIKLNSEDGVEGGLTIDDSVQIAKWLEEDGIAAIEVSGGISYSEKNKKAVRIMKIDTEEKEAYFKVASKKIKQAVTIPVILVGGIRSLPVAEKVIQDKIADAISLCRPLICEPDLILRWSQGDKSKSKCGNDNLCFRPTRNGDGLRCEVEYKKKLKSNL